MRHCLHFQLFLSLLSFVVLLGAPHVSDATAKGRLKVGYLDADDPHTGLTSLKECLPGAGAKARRVKAAGSFVGKGLDALFIGSFATGDRKVSKFLKNNSKRLVRFVQQGGVIVAFAQSSKDEAAPSWLPASLHARRSPRDCMRARKLKHPLFSSPHELEGTDLMNLEVYRGKRYYAPSLLGGTDLFTETRGFQTLARESGGARFPLIVAGRAGKGAVVMMSIAPDLACVHGLTEGDRERGCGLLKNLVAYVAGRGRDLKTDPAAFKSAVRQHEVLVFLDGNDNGRADPGEPGLPWAVVTYDFADYVAGADGRVSITVDPASPEILSLRIPDNYRSTGKWYQRVLDPGPHSFGLARLPEAGATGAASIVQLSDVHLGRNGPAEEEAQLLERFLQQLGPETSPRDLIAFSGDLTHTGDRRQFAALASVAGGLKNPVAFSMGNHDWGKGPDIGRIYEMMVAPAYYTREWEGRLVISLPTLKLDKRQRAWLDQTLKRATKKVILLLHYFPKRKQLAQFDLSQVIAVISGHWHGDLVTHRDGAAMINSPASLIGGWDFSPASARRITFEGPSVARTRLVPFLAKDRQGLSVDMQGNLAFEDGISIAAVDQGPTALAHSWSSSLPGRVLLASPAIGGDSLIVPLRNLASVGKEGAVCALALDSGEQRWCHETHASVTVEPRVVGETAVFGEVNGVVSGLDVATGTVRWTVSLEDEVTPRFAEHYMHSPGVVRRGKIYYCYQSAPFGVRSSSGEIVWTGSRFGGEDAFNHSQGVVVGKGDNSRLVCGSFLGGVFSYDLHRTGASPVRVAKKWKTCANLSGRREVWILTRSRLARFDPVTGIPSRSVRVPYAVLPSEPILGDGFAITRYGQEGLCRIDQGSGKKKWRFRTGEGAISFALNKHASAGIIGSPLLRKRRLYVPAPDGNLYVLDARTGRELERAVVGLPLVSSPLIHRGDIFVADYGGGVHAFHSGK